MGRLATATAVVAAGAIVVVGTILLTSAPGEAPGTPTAPTDAASQASALPERPDDAFAMIVESVHDGDTLRAHVTEPNGTVTDTGSTRVRLLGIDTPEISPALECWGSQATAALEALAPPGSTIWAMPDVEPRDQYDRHLLYLWAADGTFINADLVASGAARVEVYDPNRLHEPLLRELESMAIAADAGRWGACG